MKKIVFVFFCFSALTASAQEEKTKSNQITLSSALDSNNAWELGVSYMKRVCSWLGFGAGVNVFHQYSYEIQASGPYMQGVNISEWILSDNSTRVTGLQFNPFVHINTPSLFHLEDAGVNIYAEPGLLMTVSSNKCEADYWDGHGYYIARTFSGPGNDWLSFNCRIGLNLENDSGCLSIGCFISDMDMYSGKRNINIGNIRLGDYMPKRHSNWGVFLSLAMKL